MPYDATLGILFTPEQYQALSTEIGKRTLATGRGWGDLYNEVVAGMFSPGGKTTAQYNGGMVEATALHASAGTGISSSPLLIGGIIAAYLLLRGK